MLAHSSTHRYGKTPTIDQTRAFKCHYFAVVFHSTRLTHRAVLQVQPIQLRRCLSSAEQRSKLKVSLSCQYWEHIQYIHILYAHNCSKLMDTHVHTHARVWQTLHVFWPWGQRYTARVAWGQEGLHSVSVHIIQKNKAFFLLVNWNSKQNAY